MTSRSAEPHLLVVAPSAYPLGGIASWLDDLVPGLEDAGWRVTVGLTAGRYHDVSAYLDRHAFSRVVEIAAPTGTREGRLRAIESVLGRERPDLALAFNVPDLVDAGLRGRGGAGATGRVASTLHAIQYDLLQDLRPWSPAIDGVVVTNRLVARLAESIGGLEPQQVHYAPYGVAGPPPRRAFTRGDGALRVGYCGRLESFQKRVGDLATILEELDRSRLAVELWIAGTGPEEEELRRRLARRTDAGSVRFLGSLGRAELAEAFYAGIDVLLVTSSWETGPIVAWEAMAAGVPVVSSAYLGSGREGSLRDGENCLLFPVGDAPRAAACLARVATPEVADRLRRGGARLVDERYTLPKAIAAWDRALRKILRAPLRATHARQRGAAPAGRLDRWLGAGLAETIRSRIGRRFEHDAPGGEWPHSYSRDAGPEDEFWRVARLEDGNAIEAAP